jgi:dephospho-CoA kinase
MTPLPKKSKRMLIIGLTGSIGMGKSTAARILQDLGFPIYSADDAVHNLLRKNGRAVAYVAKQFPQTLKRGSIDRKLLGQAVFGQPDKLRTLERIIHPLIRTAERSFLQQARANKHAAAILEIPLLFETGADQRCDITFCVTAPRATQHARVLARPNMSPERLNAILARQMPDTEKRKRADYIIPTGKGLEATATHLSKLLQGLGLLA